MSAFNPGSGLYTVTFARDISSCVGLAAPGVYHGGSAVNGANGRVLIPASGNTVNVTFTLDSGAGVDTDFMLELIC